MVQPGHADRFIGERSDDCVRGKLTAVVDDERLRMFPCVGARNRGPTLNVGVLTCAVDPLGIVWLEFPQAVGEEIEIHLHNLGVVGDFFTNAGPICQVTRPKITGVQVTLGFGESKFIWNISKSSDFYAGDPQRCYMFAVVVDHRQTFTDMLDWFAFLGVVVEEARSGAFVSVDDEVNEASTTLAGSSEFD